MNRARPAAKSRWQRTFMPEVGEHTDASAFSHNVVRGLQGGGGGAALRLHVLARRRWQVPQVEAHQLGRREARHRLLRRGRRRATVSSGPQPLGPASLPYLRARPRFSRAQARAVQDLSVLPGATAAHLQPGVAHGVQVHRGPLCVRQLRLQALTRACHSLLLRMPCAPPRRFRLFCRKVSTELQEAGSLCCWAA